jgi:hypothetical protein
LAYSKPIAEFLHRSDDDTISNDYNNVKILAMITMILYILYIRYVGIGKLVVGDLKELVSLSRIAALGSEQSDSVPELKMAIAKALEILIAKLDNKSQTKEDIIGGDASIIS